MYRVYIEFGQLHLNLVVCWWHLWHRAPCCYGIQMYSNLKKLYLAWKGVSKATWLKIDRKRGWKKKINFSDKNQVKLSDKNPLNIKTAHVIRDYQRIAHVFPHKLQCPTPWPKSQRLNVALRSADSNHCDWLSGKKRQEKTSLRLQKS